MSSTTVDVETGVAIFYRNMLTDTERQGEKKIARVDESTHHPESENSPSSGELSYNNTPQHPLISEAVKFSGVPPVDNANINDVLNDPEASPELKNRLQNQLQAEHQKKLGLSSAPTLKVPGG